MSRAVKLHIAPSRAGAACAIHDWPTLGLPKRLIASMRALHGKGGIDACRECLERAKAEADRERGWETM